MSKRVLSVVLVLIMAVSLGLVAGCGSQKEEKKSGSGLSGSITIAGSTSVQPFSEVLAEEFMAQHNQVKINVQGGGSSQGIEAAASGVAEIGSSSRELKPEEAGRLHQYVIAKDGIAIIVHPSNPVNNLTLAQLKDIFKGKIVNWKSVGGADARISLVNREAGSGTRDGFETLVMNKEPVSDQALVANSTGAVKTTVAGDKNSIGYVSLAALDSSVKPLSVEGVQATAENVFNGKYKVQRPFIYVTREEPAGLVKAFIEYVLSAQGQEILKREGAVPVK